MTMGWVPATAINQQVSGSLAEAFEEAKYELFQFYKVEKARFCHGCNELISEARRKEFPGYCYCEGCQQNVDKEQNERLFSYRQSSNVHLLG